MSHSGSYGDKSMENPSNILFIKLGKNGNFEKDCIENRGILKIGYNEIDNFLCISNNWTGVESEIKKMYRTDQSVTTSHKNQIKKFYEEPETTMWVTFYCGKLWYCYAEKKVILNKDGTKERKTLSGWTDVDSQNNKLFIQYLSGRLTKVQGFRGTICDLKEKDYLLHKINNTQSKELAAVENDIKNLRLSLEALIKKLNPKDFEVFVDLIFRSASWSRAGVLGSTVKTIDIELFAPVTNEKAIVQVKSQASLALFNAYKKRLQNMLGYDKIFFVTHTPSEDLQKYIDNGLEDEIQIWDSKKLAEFSINAGLIEWIVNIAP